MPAILFDLDGTLVNSLSDITTWINAVRVDHGFAPKTDREIVRCIGRGAERLLRDAIPEAPETQLPQLMKSYRAYYAENPFAGGSLYPGVKETLAVLRARPQLKLGVVTNKSTPLAERTLQTYLPEIRFDIVAGPESVTRNKPDPAHLLEVLTMLRIRPSQACFLGDDPVDQICADGAGVRFFGACYGFGNVQVPPEQALHAFPELLSKLSLG